MSADVKIMATNQEKPMKRKTKRAIVELALRDALSVMQDQVSQFNYGWEPLAACMARIYKQLPELKPTQTNGATQTNDNA
jgi:hypothetical protein